MSPPGSCQPTPGAWAGSRTSRSTLRNTWSAPATTSRIRARVQSRPRRATSVAGSSVSPTSSMKRFELGKLKLRVPTCTECRGRTRGSSSARRIPLDWLKRPWAGDSSRRSRWASKWMMPTLPATASWTPATAGNRIESSPPITAGTVPAAATSEVFARTAARRRREVVGHDRRIAGVDELLGSPGDDAVLIDPVDPAVLDAHAHPGEVPPHFIGRVAGARPAEGRGTVVRRADEGAPPARRHPRPGLPTRRRRRSPPASRARRPSAARVSRSPSTRHARSDGGGGIERGQHPGDVQTAGLGGKQEEGVAPGVEQAGQTR